MEVGRSFKSFESESEVEVEVCVRVFLQNETINFVLRFFVSSSKHSNVLVLSKCSESGFEFKVQGSRFKVRGSRFKVQVPREGTFSTGDFSTSELELELELAVGVGGWRFDFEYRDRPRLWPMA